MPKPAHTAVAASASADFDLQDLPAHLGTDALWQSEAQRQRDAIRAASGPSDLNFDAQQPLSCAGLRGVRHWVQLVGQHGELGAIKALAQMHTASAAAC